MTDIISPDLDMALTEHQKTMEMAFVALKANPYRADEHINTMRKEIISTLVTLMEANIPVAVPKKERTLTDILQEAAAESASMLGSNAVAKGVSFFRDVKENINKVRDGVPANAEEIIIYEDEETGEFFYHDEDGNEVICDENGFPPMEMKTMTELNELVTKHMKNLRDGYNNRLTQLLQMKEQMEEQIKGATDNMELLLQEVDLVKQNLADVDHIIGAEEEEE